MNKTQAPKQYTQGWTEFYKLKFHLTRDVLIPRPETELLVDAVLDIAKSHVIPAPDRVRGKLQQGIHYLKPGSLIGVRDDSLTVLDLGTGSGCVAISIAKNLPAGRHGAPNAKIIATDISKEALKVAEKNAKFHHVENQIIFLEADLLPDLKISPDVIVTNLPYIPTARLMYIDPMVTEFEPRIALDGGQDGFELYRKLLSQMKEKNIHPKYLFGEIDYTHGELAVQETLRYFPKAEVEVVKDLAHMQRILKIKF